MFKWYAKAAECYVFLDDFSGMLMTEDEQLEEEAADFEDCRWFTRGWTLQELLAPTAVLFFNSKRTIIGTRVELLDWISRASRIQPQYLTGEAMIAEASVAQRMSWASNRDTSRPEDIAYSLLGIFNVNIPMLYGEGENAFLRLQRAIIENSDDETIFAWGLFEPDIGTIVGVRGRDYSPQQTVLAQSPASFRSSANVVREARPPHIPPFHFTNRGIQFSFAESVASSLMAGGRPGFLFGCAAAVMTASAIVLPALPIMIVLLCFSCVVMVTYRSYRPSQFYWERSIPLACSLKVNREEREIHLIVTGSLNGTYSRRDIVSRRPRTFAGFERTMLLYLYTGDTSGLIDGQSKYFEYSSWHEIPLAEAVILPVAGVFMGLWPFAHYEFPAFALIGILFIARPLIPGPLFPFVVLLGIFLDAFKAYFPPIPMKTTSF